MKTFVSTVLILFSIAVCVSSFAPHTPASLASVTGGSRSRLNMGFMGDEEPKKLTRDNEPEEYFSSNLDKMSDQEKLPIALAGLAFISLPFIAGLIALYATK
eukprot:CAMPEP_0183294842 /NCGR_PEP_ID=MMETSP0160_2-20130417/3006_1 /TAXON_ID=2839 ORGANISM="Odontella Sinensis, Strain Grunow 1884" /NCGR_SAMPLE_ID=MMETSP0160_2 /ASSEMBLY_ACC=CAM_ASM_000250 /LENGTH=101 /DNA_ID=CAMNT_0025456215 /DNA_START=79 /DNA_END=384 /DNA_ORIENTATION=-